MSPSTRDGDKATYPVFNGDRDKFHTYQKLFMLYLRKKKLLGYILRRDYDPSKTYVYQDYVVPALVFRKAKDSGPRTETKEEKAQRKAEKAELKERTANEQTDTCYCIMTSHSAISRA